MDTETGMYYLMSRYYDPVTHRFLNADGYFQTGLGVLDANMNAYCGNNPIMNSDPTGNCPTHKDWYQPTCVICNPAYADELDKYNKKIAKKTAVAEAVKSNSSSLPKVGPPNSKLSLYNQDGTLKQERWYGSDGLPIRDRDYNHSGSMDFPHDHEWINGERQKEHLPPSPEYQFSWDYTPSFDFHFDLPYYYNPPTGERPFWETVWQYFSTLE